MGSDQGCTQVDVTTKFFTLVPNIWRLSSLSLPHAEFLKPRILRWLPRFLKICALLFLKVHYCVQNSAPPIPILNQLKLAQILPPYLIMAPFDVTRLSPPSSPKWHTPSKHTDKGYVRIYVVCLMPSPSLQPWFHHLNTQNSYPGGHEV